MITPTQEKSDWTIQKLLDWTTNYLQQSRIDQPRLCAELLLAHVLQCQRIELYTRFDFLPDPDQLQQFRDFVKRCRDHEPVAYLTGKAHFYSLSLDVSPAVLIPRPQTEVLVTQAINFLRRETTRSEVRVLDLCTGTACVALAVASNVIEAEIIAADISPDALDIARRNIENHNLQNRITLLESDLLTALDTSCEFMFDLIVANPPYIAASEYEKLEPVVRDYEPPLALRAGPDGLDIIRRIIADTPAYLADGGALMIEIAYNQESPVQSLFKEKPAYQDIQTIKDELGHPRVVRARKP